MILILGLYSPSCQYRNFDRVIDRNCARAGSGLQRNKQKTEATGGAIEKNIVHAIVKRVFLT